MLGIWLFLERRIRSPTPSNTRIDAIEEEEQSYRRMYPYPPTYDLKRTNQAPTIGRDLG